MPIKITDETAGVVLLTIDNTGLICFGNGTPINQVSVSGVAVIDSAGQVTNQTLAGTSLILTVGTVTCAPGSSVSVTTLSGRLPVVQLDVQWPQTTATYDPGGGGTIAHCVFTKDYTKTVHKLFGVYSGGFNVKNNDLPDADGFCTLPDSDDANYRWL